MRILIQGGYVIDIVENSEKNCEIKDILIENDRIKKVEKNIVEKADKVIKAEGKVVMPGLINGHNHVAMTIFRGYADDCNLMEWLETKIFPAEDKLDEKMAYYSSLLGCVEMIKSGTTTFNDMYFFMDAVAKAVGDSGMRAMLGRGVTIVNDEDDKRLQESEKLIQSFNGAYDGRVTTNIAPYAPYSCNEEALRRCVEMSKKYNMIIHTHLAETEFEVEQIKSKYGVTPTQFLKNNGIFDVPVVLAHGIWLDDEDISIIKNIKGGIVHNPISNCKLGSGIADVSRLLKEGITVGLGTDGTGSTNTLDMFEEMRVCNYLQKVKQLNSAEIDAYTALKMATINGAKLLGLDKEIGSIEVGKKADIILLDMNKIHFNPLNNIVSNIVYSANGADVNTTIINGNIVMENRRVLGIDEEDLINQCNQIAIKLFE